MTEINTAVVGSRYHDGALDALYRAAEGQAVELVRQPDNKYDPNAVQVLIGEVMCGFVPRQDAVQVAAKLDAGKTVTAQVYGGTRLKIEIVEGDDGDR